MLIKNRIGVSSPTLKHVYLHPLNKAPRIHITFQRRIIKHSCEIGNEYHILWFCQFLCFNVPSHLKQVEMAIKLGNGKDFRLIFKNRLKFFVPIRIITWGCSTCLVTLNEWGNFRPDNMGCFGCNNFFGRKMN